jgi:hypothetical protein
MHDADAALTELQHAQKDLGMCAVLFPATGVHLNLGAKPYWPVYAEAARLGIPVVVHGGGHWDLGMETMNVSTGANAIGHPMSLAIALAEMVLNNLFERFKGLRVAYLEGGPLWFLMALERLSRSFEAGTPVNPRGELLQLPEGQSVSDYIFELVRAGRLVVGIEGGESDLPYAVKVAASRPSCSRRIFRMRSICTRSGRKLVKCASARRLAIARSRRSCAATRHGFTSSMLNGA